MYPKIVETKTFDQQMADSMTRVIVVEANPEELKLCLFFQDENGDFVNEHIVLPKEQCFWLRDRIRRLLAEPIVPTNRPIECVTYQVSEVV